MTIPVTEWHRVASLDELPEGRVKTVTVGTLSLALVHFDALLDTWDSLDDRGVAGGTWDEANPSATQLAELQEAGVTTLNQGDGFNLGTLFNTGPTFSQDLQFEFLIAGTELGFPGEVVYEAP